MLGKEFLYPFEYHCKCVYLSYENNYSVWKEALIPFFLILKISKISVQMSILQLTWYGDTRFLQICLNKYSTNSWTHLSYEKKNPKGLKLQTDFIYLLHA